MKRSLLFTVFIALAAFTAPAQTKIPAKDAAKHIGETVIICDKVYGTRFFDESSMTLLNLGADHPNELLTVVINGADRSKFKDKPEEYFKGANVCVTGKIVDYKGRPEIVVSDPKDLKIEMTDSTVKQKGKIDN